MSWKEAEKLRDRIEAERWIRSTHAGHDAHAVAYDPERDDLWCMDCAIYFASAGYRSPYASGEPPFYLWRDVPIPMACYHPDHENPPLAPCDVHGESHLAKIVGP
jgi:hypothetical protein